MVATAHTSGSVRPATGPTAGDVAIADLSNDSIIIRLHFMINHLSRWLTPIHNLDRLDRAIFRNEPSIKDLLIAMRQEERRVFPKLHLIASENNPNLDRIPMPVITSEQAAIDQQRSALSAQAEIRRLRQGTCSLLRSLTDSGWKRVGTSRLEHDWQVRGLAEHLVAHDEAFLTAIDVALDKYGLRENVAEHGRARLFELLKLIPVTTRRGK
jgi:hypothetical protein